MDFVLIVFAGILLLVGLIGCILPVIPGPPISYLGILLMHLTSRHQFSNTFLIVFAILVILVTVLDFYVPAWGTKKFGGSKAGNRGAVVGLIIGMLIFPPLGLIVGSFIGAVAGELISNKPFDASLRSGVGSFVGFLLGAGMKLIVSFSLIFYYIKSFL